MPVSPDRELLIPTLKDQYPEYFIYGPIVFEPVSKKVVDWKISPFGRHEFYGVDVTE